MSNNNFSKNLKKLRKDKHLTQEKLGQLAGVPRNTITVFENGLRFPRKQMIDKLCAALDCKESDLMGYDAKGASYEYATIDLPELINMTRIDDNADDDYNYAPIPESVSKNYQNGNFFQTTTKTYCTDIPPYSYCYLYKESDISNYDSHICLFNHKNTNYMSRIYIAGNDIVATINDQKTIIPADNVDITGRVVYFQHFAQGL